MRTNSELPWNQRKRRALRLHRMQFIGRIYWEKPGQRQQQGGIELFSLGQGKSIRNARVKSDLAQARMYNAWFILSSSQSQVHSWLQGLLVKSHLPLQLLWLFLVCWETNQKTGQCYSGAVMQLQLKMAKVVWGKNPYSGMALDCLLKKKF